MRRARRLVALLLATWALGLLIATLQLQAWQAAMTGVLVQMQADALLRANALQAGTAIEPPWYRRRALSLLTAVEQLHDDVAWTLVMPGSWRRFDDLQERVAHGLGQAFGRIVIETVRRELEARAASLTGVPHDPQTAAVNPAGRCLRPATDNRPRAATLEVEALAEHEALRSFLYETQRLDQAVASLRALAQPAPGNPQALRTLVRYSLGEDLSVPASRSLALFRARPDAGDPQAAAMVSRLQNALQCSAREGLRALQSRLAGGNALLESEDMLMRTMQPSLFVPVNAHDSGDSTLRLQAAAWLIEEQAGLLAPGGHAWLVSDGIDSGQEALLQRLAAISLLGPAFAAEQRVQALAAQARLRQAFAARLGSTDAGLVWDEVAGQLVLSPYRQALYTGLRRLLDQPFMRAESDPPAARLADIVALAIQRQHFTRQVLPLFPPGLRAEAARHVDGRIGALAATRARRYVLADGPQGAVQRLIEVEAALAEAGTPGWANVLVQWLSPEVFSCAGPSHHCLAPPPGPSSPWGDAAEPAVRS